jgi:phosphopantothenoylcysteine decarboxylase/phosphopantothenate--cysteine ligase
VDTNIVTLIERSGRIERLPKMAKEDVAGAILDRVQELRAPRRAAVLVPRRR